MIRRRKFIAMLLVLLSTVNVSGVKVLAAEDKMKDVNVQENVSMNSEEPSVDISSIEVDKQQAKPGDNVKVSFKVTNKEKVKEVRVDYVRPISHNNEQVTMKYNEESGEFEGYLNVDNKYQSGKWKVLRIWIADNENNYYVTYNKEIVIDSAGEIVDLSKGDFEVTGTDITKVEQVDTKAPVIDVSSLKVSEKEVKAGDLVKLSVKASDDMSGIASIKAQYIKPALNLDDYIETVEMIYNAENNDYEAVIRLPENSKAGDWRLFSLTASDVEGNNSFYGSSKVSEGNFTVKSEIVIEDNSNKVESGVLTPGTTVDLGDLNTNVNLNNPIVLRPSTIPNINFGDLNTNFDKNLNVPRQITISKESIEQLKKGLSTVKPLDPEVAKEIQAMIAQRNK